MELALYQILILAFCLVMILKALSHFFRQERTIRELVTLLLFWGSLATIAMFPDVTSVIATIFGIKSNVNALVFTLLGLLSYFCLSLMMSVENLEQVVTKLTRELALRETKDTPRKKDV